MQLNMRNALAFVFDVDLNELSACQPCQDTLYAYIDAELEGEEAETKFPEIKAHLGKCVLCQQSYNDLKPLLLMERESWIIPPEPELELDFSYLKKIAQRGSLWKDVALKLNQRAAHLSGELRILIRQGVATFHQLPFGAQSPALALKRRSTNEQVPLVTLPDKEANIKISVAVAAVSDDRLSLTVRVESLQPSRPVRRVKVTLNERHRQGMMLQGAYTKANGQVEFAKINLGDYLIIVKHKKREWQIPISP